MVTSSWLTVAAAVLEALSLLPGAAAFTPPVGPLAPDVNFCPERCVVSGPNTGNWSAYPDFKTIRLCQKTMFYDFSLYDTVDDQTINHRIQACSSFGPDFDSLPTNSTPVESADSVTVEFELGWWNEGFGLAKAALRSLVGQIREYIDNGHGEFANRPFIMYGQSGQATIGVYIGQGLLNQGLSGSALRVLQDSFDNLDDVTTPSLAMQLCGSDYDSTHIFGVAVTSNATFAPIQNAIKSWANATCLSFVGSKNITGKAKFTTPLLNATVPSNSTAKFLLARANCRTVQVESGDGCAQLATKCGISGADFTKYNPNICSTLKPKQHVCCSSGTLPDFRPKPKSDGSCFSYQVQNNDNCANIAAEYSLTLDEIESFNKNTWGWSGCKMLYAQTVMCLSTGKAPFPAAIANAVCGPQKPGSKPPTDGSNITNLNPCPLNACCNIWGQCGITKDFCVDTNTGPPGTAKAGTYGCISNCGLDIITGTGTGAIKLAYFQGYGMGRKCLYQDALQIDTSKYTHIHFGFGTLTPSYEVRVGDLLATYQFTQFKRIKNAKRILSFGGWDFSTFPDTYKIFREGVQAQNRVTMATNIANFIKLHNLDGVDIDWEYPGAPDLPEFDPGKEEDGPNYLRFLITLKSLLPGKTVAIAAPASYWYLKQFPIKAISGVVDYIVYMTYDLHGQWDAQNQWAQEGCATGNCLRSQVNLTETKQALALITKAGVPGNKIVVGVTSYGRSFAMEKAGCWGPTCKFTGTRLQSLATPGRCTDTRGYIANAEIDEIIGTGRVVTSFVDGASNSDILVYDTNQWVGYMSESTKQSRTALYARWGMAGTTDWASDLQRFNSPPRPVSNWANFISRAAAGLDPKEDTSTVGTWKTFDCTHPDVSDEWRSTPSERWKALDADSAWREAVTKWFNTDQSNGLNFVESLSRTFKMGGDFKCGDLSSENCRGAIECEKGLDGPYSGPAAYLIWRSLSLIHRMHANYWQALANSAGFFAAGADHMEDVFAPIPEAKTNQWLFILIDLLTMGTLTAAAPFFNNFLKTLPAFSNPTVFDNAKDITLNLIGQSTTLAKDALQNPAPDEWTPEEQNKFSHYVGQVIYGWMNITEISLAKLFDGSQESVRVLGDAIADGKLVEQGKRDPSIPRPPDPSLTQVQGDIIRTLYGYAIPALWRLSKTYAFVVDSGASCDGHPLGKYLDDSTADDTGVCYEGRRYYLVNPAGDSTTCTCQWVTGSTGGCQNTCSDSKFSAPVGLGNLPEFLGISKEELVIGSVRTWIKNGRNNGAPPIDPIGDGSTKIDLLNVDITTPGYIRLPVCSPDRAFQSWDTSTGGSSDNYPCDIPPGKNTCGDSSFENQTSGASPLVSDCLQIIRNIEGNANTEFTHRITGQRELLSYGTCAFGVERTGGTGGAVEFKVGGQDVIDLINAAVSMYGGSGQVGAKGVMSCDGTTVNTHVDVLWGLY